MVQITCDLGVAWEYYSWVAQSYTILDIDESSWCNSKDAQSSHNKPPFVIMKVQPNKPKFIKVNFSHLFVVVNEVDS
jgi:hypothetical protein